MRRSMRMAAGLALAVLALAAAGCFGTGGKGTYPVSGSVKFADGSPLTKGVVVFTSKESTGRGEIKGDGSYAADVPAGSYKVYLMGASEAGSGSDYAGKPLVAQKFTSSETSGLQCEVKSGKNTFDVKVEKP